MFLFFCCDGTEVICGFVDEHACVCPRLLCPAELKCFSCDIGSSESHLWISDSICSKDGKTDRGFSTCGDVIVLRVAAAWRNTQFSLSCSWIPLYTDGRTLIAENQYAEFSGSFSPAAALSLAVCAPVETLIVFPPLSWQSRDCRSHLPVKVPQERTVRDYNGERWAVCTLEPVGHVICRVCIIFF